MTLRTIDANGVVRHKTLGHQLLRARVAQSSIVIVAKEVRVHPHTLGRIARQYGLPSLQIAHDLWKYGGIPMAAWFEAAAKLRKPLTQEDIKALLEIGAKRAAILDKKIEGCFRLTPEQEMLRLR